MPLPKTIYQILLFNLLLLYNQCTSPTSDTNNTPIRDSLSTTVDNSTIIIEDSSLSELLTKEEETEFDIPNDPIPADAYVAKDANFNVFDRTTIENKLRQKIEQQQPLVAHILVPLCDNTYQGIVPTTESLGNGFSLKTNLYWATSTGMKRYFKEKKHWTLLKSIKNVYRDSVVLERVVFKRTYPNQATVYLVADAYRGDKMYETVNHFLRAISDNHQEIITVEDSINISIHGGADLVAFNGHNGLFDLYYNQPDQWFNEQQSQKDMVVIACYANEYFEREAMRAKAYPLVRAISRLHPGAFVVSAIIDDWAMLKDTESIRLSAGRAYCEIHDCSIKTSKKLFYSGWKPDNLNDPLEEFND